MTQEQITGATGALGSGGSLDSYDVPGSVVITPYSVSAVFDGSGASGAFLPCLTFKTQTGAIIARCPAPEVASGDTAEVSWFPHVAQTTSAPPPSGSGLPWALLTSGLPVIATGVQTTVSLDPGSPTFAEFDTSDGSMFALVAGGGGDYGIEIQENGLYLIQATAQLTVTASPAAGSAAFALWNSSAAIWPVGNIDGAPFLPDVTGASSWHADAQASQFISLDPGDVPAPVTLQLVLEQNSGRSTSNVSTVSAIVTQVNPTGSPDF